LASSALSQSTGGQDGAVTDDERLLMWLPHVGCFVVMVCFLGGALLILKRSQLKLAQQSQEVQLTTLTKAIRAVLDAKVIKSVAPKVKVQLGPNVDVEEAPPRYDASASAKHIEEASAERGSSFEKSNQKLAGVF
jgi:hypothetical protein